jgi:hypothetical protein
MRVYTGAEFDQISWHDCQVWAIELRAGDVYAGEWISELVLRLDFIVEWLCGLSGEAQFRVAPAVLVFHGVTDLSISIDWGRGGFQGALQDAAIDRIEREPIRGQRVYLDRPYYRWTISLNGPPGGAIAFGAYGFTQTLCGEPVVVGPQQRLSLKQRGLPVS